LAVQTTGLSAIGNSYIDSLLSGVQWGRGSTIAFSFNRATTLLNINTYDWSPDAKQAIRDAFSSISAVINLDLENRLITDFNGDS